MEAEETDIWHYLPDPVLLHIFSYLSARELASARRVCTRWSCLAMDEFLWKRLFYLDFHIDRAINKASVDSLWSEEYRRLTDEVPCMLTEQLDSHSNQVLHVSFSHDGSMFATASKDGSVIVWDATRYPCRRKFGQDMTEYSWRHPQFSQFNGADTLLLVSGIHFGSPHNTSGEIAVFSVQYEFLLQCRVANKPYDAFGCWLGDTHLISSDMHWLAHLTSLSTLWVNRASQSTESEHIPVIAQLFRMYNCSASSVRSVMVADNKVRDKSKEGQEVLVENHFAPYLHHDRLAIVYKPEYYEQYRKTEPESPKSESTGKGEGSSERETLSESSECSSKDQDFIDGKLLIYTRGTKTYTPHQVCFKYIENLQFPKQLQPGPPIKDRIAARQRDRERRGEEGPDWTDYEAVRYMFDEPDRVIDMHGYIIGMALSPDHKYLYLNVQVWPGAGGRGPRDPLHPPPVAQPFHMHVLDLTSLQVVGSMVRPTPFYSDNGYFVFLDVSQHFVGSGAEKRNAYIWERHYGAALTRLEHGDVVNAVAFSPRGGLFVTACDDYGVRVWRSKAEVRRLGLRGRQLVEGSRLHRKRPCSYCE